MKKTDLPKMRIMSYGDARKLLSGSFSWQKSYLCSVVAKYYGGGLADNIDYRTLRHLAYKLRGVAEKILRSRREKESRIKGIIEREQGRLF